MAWTTSRSRSRGPRSSRSRAAAPRSSAARSSAPSRGWPTTSGSRRPRTRRAPRPSPRGSAPASTRSSTRPSSTRRRLACLTLTPRRAWSSRSAYTTTSSRPGRRSVTRRTAGVASRCCGTGWWRPCASHTSSVCHSRSGPTRAARCTRTGATRATSSCSSAPVACRSSTRFAPRPPTPRARRGCAASVRSARAPTRTWWSSRAT